MLLCFFGVLFVVFLLFGINVDLINIFPVGQIVIILKEIIIKIFEIVE